MIPAYEIMHLSPLTLRDINIERFDFESNASYIICRAFEYGSMEDLAEVWAYYGDTKTKDALLNASLLRKQTRLLAAHIFNIPVSSFLSSHSTRNSEAGVVDPSSRACSRITFLRYKQTISNNHK